MVSHAGSALLSQGADKTEFTKALSRGLSGIRERRGAHDPGRVVRDPAVMLADGGEALTDLGAVREQAPLFGAVASDSTAYRLIERIASDAELLESLRAAHAVARTHAWKLGGAPDQLTIDLDATLIGSHSEKQGAAGNFKGGYGFHRCSPTSTSLRSRRHASCAPATPGRTPPPIRLRSPRRRSSPRRQRPLQRRLRARRGAPRGDRLAARGRLGAGAEPGRQRASQRRVADITHLLELDTWPEGSRVIVRRERPHPGPLSFTDHDGHRFQAILTDQAGEIAVIERRHRARVRVEDQIRDDKDTAWRSCPSATLR